MNEVLSFPNEESRKTSSREILDAAKEIRDQGAAGKVRRHMEYLASLLGEITYGGFEIIPEIDLRNDGAAGHVLIKLSPLQWHETFIEIPMLDEHFGNVPNEAFVDAYPDAESIRRAYTATKQKIFEIVGSYTLSKNRDSASIALSSEGPGEASKKAA
jgi:hypothetical protein